MKRNHINEAKLKILDVIALLKDIPGKKLAKGQVGTIVEVLDGEVYEVEFANKKSQTTASLRLKTRDMMLLHFEMETVS